MEATWPSVPERIEVWTTTGDCGTTARVTVNWRLAHSPPSPAIRVQSPVGSPDFCMWESCRMMPFIGGFSRGSPVSRPLSFQYRSILTSTTHIGFRDLAVKSRPNLFTHSLTHLYPHLVPQLLVTHLYNYEVNASCCQCSSGSTVWQWLGRSPPTTGIRARYPTGSLPDFRMGDAACRFPVGFLGILPSFSPPLHSSAAQLESLSLGDPVAKPGVVRSLLNITANEDMSLRQFDVKINCFPVW
ncbi:hypothetical protein PR048_028289 [Dryococelus australis]|uniref:Uncharacterized protein n=1 Tax=Dryococelus australis TaxID=614101 RepID=A0ABQ9GIU5_9NEOP|nr:hypothetical protein PR048_028289 [Dryococelus australis]